MHCALQRRGSVLALARDSANGDAAAAAMPQRALFHPLSVEQVSLILRCVNCKLNWKLGLETTLEREGKRPPFDLGCFPDSYLKHAVLSHK